MSVFSNLLRKDIKEKMNKCKDKINWAEETREFTEEKIRVLEAEDNIKKVVEELSQIPVKSPRGSSTASLREDRESH